MVDPVKCEKCGKPMEPCFATNAKGVMTTGAWLCRSCGHTSTAIGRERAITLSDWRKRNAK